MVLGDPKIVIYLFIHAYRMESAHRTDGSFPLLMRLYDALTTLDSQPNKVGKTYPSYGFVYEVTIEYYTIYYLYNGKDAYIFNLSIKDDSKYNLRISQPITTTVSHAALPKNYKSYPNGGRFDRGTLEFVYRRHKSRGREISTFNIFDHANNCMLLDVDFDEIIPISQYNDGTYGKGYYYGDKGWYKIYSNGYYEYIDTTESNESVIHLTQSDLRMIIETVVYRYKHCKDGRKKRQLNEKYYNPFREPLIDGDLNGYDILEGAKEEQIICDLPEKGWVEDIRMYSMMRNQGKTYCLYRRVDNGKYFFVEVYDDPHDKEHLHGKAVPKKNVPDFILNDAISLIRHS